MNAKRIFAGIAATTLATTLVACGDLAETEPESTGKQTDSSSEEKTDAAKDKNTIGNWKLLNKPKIKKGQFGTFANVKLKVRNISDSEDEPWLEIRVTRGKNLVTTFDCIGRTIRPDETTTLDCSSMDNYKKWTEYEVKNAF